MRQQIQPEQNLSVRQSRRGKEEVPMAEADRGNSLSRAERKAEKKAAKMQLKAEKQAAENHADCQNLLTIQSLDDTIIHH